MNIEQMLLRSRQVYSVLADEESKFIFRKRALWSFTGSMASFFDLASLSLKRDQGICLSETLAPCKRQELKLVILGCGFGGQSLARILMESGYNITMFCDNAVEKQGTSVLGIPVNSVDALKSVGSNVFVIVALGADADKQFVSHQLAQLGIASDRCLYPFLEYPNQYFDESFLQFGVNDVFLDCGCFDGCDSLQFTKLANDTYNKIYVFEPDPHNMLKCKQSLSTLPRIEFVQSAVSHYSGEGTFQSDGTTGAKLTNDGNYSISVIKLDDVVQEPVTFIKMDIEGAELSALKGAEMIIKRDKPQLAICVYHKPEDIIDIPYLLKQWVPEYKIYLRHRTAIYCETVCFAVL